MNRLFYGDNLQILREHAVNESVDLIYLDPPFNSKRDYNLLFKTPKGHESDAQITAFEDSWHWGQQAENEFAEILKSSNTDVAELIQTLRSFLGENDMMAYLTMMANRLLELHRILKPTGSLYLHCDPTASHYLKILMDAVFGHEQFRNEIIWHYRRWTGKANKFQELHDVIFFYTKSNDYKFNVLYTEYTEGSKARKEQGILHRFKKGDEPYLVSDGEVDEKGVRENDVWQIPFIAPSAKERMGYPTQKPLALLERIIQASSNKGDVVLDPFCGCGTAVHAAQKLGRRWIGIDITHLAVSLIEKRMRDAFPDIEFKVEGTPKDLEGARDLAERDKYQFQWWACSLVNAQPFQGKKKGADSGIDGLIFFQDDTHDVKKIVVSVKGGENVSVAMVRDFAHVIEREKAALGLFVSLTEPTRPMVTEAVSAGFYKSVANAKKYPKLQILTIENLLNGSQRAEFPDLAMGAQTFKKAKKEQKGSPEQKGLF